MSEKKFATNQPKHGDLVMACPHALEATAIHFYRPGEGSLVVTDKGETLKPDVCILCDACHKLYGADISKAQWGAVFDWIGDEPFVTVAQDA